MKLKKFLEVIKFKITDFHVHMWDSYGENALSISREEKLNKKICNVFKYSASCVFDSISQNLCEVAFWDYENNKAFRWIDESYLKDYKAECKKRNVSFSNASDNLNFEDVSLRRIISLIDKNCI